MSKDINKLAEEAAKKEFPDTQFSDADSWNRKCFIAGYTAAKEDKGMRWADEDMIRFGEFCLDFKSNGIGNPAKLIKEFLSVDTPLPDKEPQKTKKHEGTGHRYITTEWLEWNKRQEDKGGGMNVFESSEMMLLESIESEILSFMIATDNQMLIKGLRETLLIVQRHKKKLLDESPSPSSPVATKVDWDALIDELSNCAVCSGYNHRCEDIFDKEKAMGILKAKLGNE